MRDILRRPACAVQAYDPGHDAIRPLSVHCAAGGRAAALWMINRVKADRWAIPRALEEANALGLNDRFRPFALDYLRAHP